MSLKDIPNCAPLAMNSWSFIDLFAWNTRKAEHSCTDVQVKHWLFEQILHGKCKAFKTIGNFHSLFPTSSTRAVSSNSIFISKPVTFVEGVLSSASNMINSWRRYPNAKVCCERAPRGGLFKTNWVLVEAKSGIWHLLLILQRRISRLCYGLSNQHIPTNKII